MKNRRVASQYWQAVKSPYQDLPKWVQVTGGIGSTLLIVNPLTLAGALLACFFSEDVSNPPPAPINPEGCDNAIDVYLSSDESRAAITCKISEEREDIFVRNLATGETERMTSEGIHRHPRLNGDGSRLVYQERLNGGLPDIRYRNLVTGEDKSIRPDDYSFCYDPAISADASAAAYVCGMDCEPGIAFCQSFAVVWSKLDPGGEVLSSRLVTPPGTVGFSPSLKGSGDQLLFSTNAFAPQAEGAVPDTNGQEDVYLCKDLGDPVEPAMQNGGCQRVSLDAHGAQRAGWSSFPKFFPGDDSKFSYVPLNGAKASTAVGQMVGGGFELLGEFDTGLPEEGAKVAPPELAYHSLGGPEGKLLFHPSDAGFLIRHIQGDPTTEEIIVDDVVNATIRGGMLGAGGDFAYVFDVEGRLWVVPLNPLWEW